MIELYKYTDTEKKKLLNSMQIICDTREHEEKNQHVLNSFDEHGVKWTKRKLNFGDYAPLIPKDESLNIPRDLDFSSLIMIERKRNLEEVSGNWTDPSERARIKKELALAPQNKVMIIESNTYADLVHGKYNTQYKPASFLASYHAFWHEFDIPIIFMPDPSLTGLFIVNYFRYFLREIIK